MVINREKDAIVYKGIHYSYKQLLQYSLRYQHCFTIDGRVPKRVMMFSENSAEYVFAIYGTLRHGATAVPVDVMSTDKELRYMINDCRPDIIFVTPEKKEFVTQVVHSIKDFTTHILTPLEINLERVDQEPIVEIPMGANDTVVAIIYTSGTTGSPKGVMLTYKNFWYNIDAVINQVPIFRVESNVILILPLHHVFPFAGSLLAPIYAGGTVHIAESLVPEALLKTFQEGKISVVIGVPRLYEALAKGIMSKINASFVTRTIFKLAALINSRALSKRIFKAVHDKFGGNMEFFVSGGAALPIETARIFRTLGFYVLEGFGMTECAPMISFTRPGEWKIGYCGRLLPGLEMRIEENGEICVKGPNVMQGYYNRTEETAAILRDGWLYTGDTGILHPKYGVKITGRIKEIIVTSNGKNINPVEIENAITQSSLAIKELAVFLHQDVLQAIVYPDMNIVRSNTGMTIEETIKPEIEFYNRNAMSYKRIKRFHITSQELPKTRLGKIQRYKLDSLVNGDKRITQKEDLSAKSDIYIALKHFIDNETGISADGDAHFEIDLALDSLGRISLLAYIEDSYGVTIKEDQFDNLSTLNKLSEYIEKHASSIGKESHLSWKEILVNNKTKVELPNSDFIHWFMFTFIKCFFHCFYRFSLKQNEKLPTGPCLFVANHCSGFDGVFITSKLGWKTIHKTFFFAKDKHFQSGFKKFMAKHNNIILMDINSNVRSSLQQMYQVIEQGNNIIIFPEGTRSKTGEMKEFKESFAILSDTLNVPVVPIAIKGSEHATYSKIRVPRFLSRIKVEFLPAIYPNQLVKSEEQKVNSSKLLKEETAKAIKQALQNS